MKIDSSTVGMESARSYRSTSTTFRRFAILNYRQELTGGNGGLHTAVGGNTANAGQNAGNAGTTAGNGGSTGTSSGNSAGKADPTGKADNSDGGSGEATEGLAEQNAAALRDWQSRLQTSGSSVTVRSSASQTLANIRQTTIRYIFDLLFSARRNRLNQWMQNNGIQTVDNQTSTGWQEGQQGYTGNSGGVYDQNGFQKLEPGTRTQTLKVLNYNQAVIQTEAEFTSFSTVCS